ncbi:hypothetical protein SAE01_45700 [Segetibacter aerophilus]|uniref:Uncharacterized protein n=2 Tax=Segetibacter aerophilus TaxID=670293 RepID=A0A512BJE3_9BACT|nr:hypothetical protein SAE01_45700 [Segetibacter aerophilus]
MEATAGAYKVLVSVQPPDVIPGIAKVKVYLQNGSASAISLRAIYFQAGDEGAPEPDLMTKVPGQQLQFEGETWLMSSGSSSVQINITGSLGKGEIIVPVVATSTAKKEMPASTGRLLAALGILLFILMVTIIGAAVSDAITKRGDVVPPRRKRIRLISMSIAAVLTSLVVYGGNAWWQSWANGYRKYMFRPTQAVSKVNENGSNELTFRLDTSSQRRSSFPFIIPDHGKLMHMFVMRIPAMDAFAHLHPQRIDTTTFRTILPGLPKGKYLVFGDIVYNSGYTETIKDTFDITNTLTNIRTLDSDDAFAYAIPSDLVDNPQLPDAENTIVCGKPGTGVKLKDGSTMVWEGMTNEPLEASKLYSLKFQVIGPDKQPAKLDPYLGMAGHAAIVRSDGNVYIHLHPVGTFSMAAETNLVKRMADPQGMYHYPDPNKFYDSVNTSVKHLSTLNEADRNDLLMQQMQIPQKGMQGMEHNNSLEFPYSFPSAGKYRIWVQVKRNGQVLTAAFDRLVE